MEDAAYVSLARQMLSRLRESEERMCGACTLVAGAVEASRLSPPDKARERISQALKRAFRPAAHAAVADPMDWIDEDLRSTAQVVFEHLQASRVARFFELRGHLARIGVPNAGKLLARLSEQMGFRAVVDVDVRGRIEDSVWRLRGEVVQDGSYDA
jgi:hypothetical protein